MNKNLLSIKSAVVATIVFFAILHLVILGIKSLYEQNPSYLNIFSILEIESFVPEALTKGIMANVYSLILIVLVLIAFYLI